MVGIRASLIIYRKPGQYSYFSKLCHFEAFPKRLIVYFMETHPHVHGHKILMVEVGPQPGPWNLVPDFGGTGLLFGL